MDSTPSDGAAKAGADRGTDAGFYLRTVSAHHLAILYQGPGLGLGGEAPVGFSSSFRNLVLVGRCVSFMLERAAPVEVLPTRVRGADWLRACSLSPRCRVPRRSTRGLQVAIRYQVLDRVHEG